MTLTEFLEARLDEDERLAQQAIEEAEEPAERKTRYPYPEQLARCMHDARHGPARVLREVEAGRKILAEHQMEQGFFPPSCVRCWDGYGDEVPEEAVQTIWPCPTIVALASVYADHPDYEAWRP